MHGSMNVKFGFTAYAYLCDVGLGYRSNFTFYFDDFLKTKEVFKFQNLRLQDCLILKIKALRTVEKSVTVYHSIRCNILDDLSLYQCHCEKLISFHFVSTVVV